MNKAGIRRVVKATRTQLNQANNAQILQNIRANRTYAESKGVMIFYPLEGEINLLELLKDEGKQFYLPRTEEEDIIACPYAAGDELSVSRFGTMEPLTAAVDKNAVDLVVVPALCADRKGYRIGYGKGFYDRFLNGFNGKTIIAISSCYVVESLVPDKFDENCDLVITENCL